MRCPGCDREFAPRHKLRRYCYDAACLAARNRASVAKAAGPVVVAGPPRSALRRRQLERCGVGVER